MTAAQGATGVSSVNLDGKHVYWTQGSGTFGIWQAGLGGENPVQIIQTPFGVQSAVVNDDDIYWTMASGSNSLGHAVLAPGGGIVPDSQKNDFITGAGGPIGIAVQGDQLYWANSSSNAIGRATLADNGNSVANVTQSFITGATTPNGLAVNSTHLFWSVFNGGTGTTIGRIGLNGAGGTNSFITGISAAARGLSVDTNYLYWASFGSGFPAGTTYGRGDPLSGGPASTFLQASTIGGGQPIDMDSQRTSTTTISCNPDPVVTEATTTCTASVVDSDVGAAARPDGTVHFTTTGGGIFGNGNQGDEECTLAPVTIGTSTCSVTYTPFDAGDETIGGEYTGNARYAFSSNQDALTITVPPHPTTTAVDCNPDDPQVDSDTTCTVTVTDTAEADTTHPAGNVNLSSTGGGDFTPAASCALQDDPEQPTVSTCEVTYEPETAGPDTVTASYPGATALGIPFGESDDDAVLDVQPLPPHPTTTALTCDPPSVALAAASTCTVTVTDVATDERTIPDGTVSFTTDAGGSLAQPSCELSAGIGATAVCAVQFTATTSGPHTITASLIGSAGFATSTGEATVTGEGPALPPAPLPGGATGERAAALQKCKKKKKRKLSKKSYKKCKKKAKKLPV